MSLEAANLPAADVSDQEFLALEDETKEEVKEEVKEEKEEELPVEDEPVDDDKVEEEEKEPEAETEEVPEDSKVLVAKLREVDPQIFKKVPFLRSIIYSQREYSKLFSDPGEARQVYDDYESLSHLSSDLLSGNVKSLLDAVGQDTNGALEKVAKNFLPTLYAKNESLFLKVSVPIINGVLRSALAEAKSTGNKNLELAARYIAKHVHGDPEIPDDRVKRDPEKEALEQKLQERDQRDSNNYEYNVRDYAAQGLEAEVEKVVGPQFSGIQREVIMRKVTEVVHELLEADQDHNRIMNSLWKRAKFSGLNPQVGQRLVQTYIAKAKAVLPGISSKILAEFSPKITAISKPKPQFPQSGGGGKPEKSVSSKSVDYRKSSDMDILLGKATLKK